MVGQNEFCQCDMQLIAMNWSNTELTFSLLLHLRYYSMDTQHEDLSQQWKFPILMWLNIHMVNAFSPVGCFKTKKPTYQHRNFYYKDNIDGLAQDCGNYAANELGLLQSHAKPSRWCHNCVIWCHNCAICKMIILIPRKPVFILKQSPVIISCPPAAGAGHGDPMQHTPTNHSTRISPNGNIRCSHHPLHAPTHTINHSEFEAVARHFFGIRVQLLLLFTWCLGWVRVFFNLQWMTTLWRTGLRRKMYSIVFSLHQLLSARLQ